MKNKQTKNNPAHREGRSGLSGQFWELQGMKNQFANYAKESVNVAISPHTGGPEMAGDAMKVSTTIDWRVLCLEFLTSQ